MDRMFVWNKLINQVQQFSMQKFQIVLKGDREKIVKSGSAERFLKVLNGYSRCFIEDCT